MNDVLEKYRRLLIQKRYSKNTLDIYCNYFKDFVIYFKDSNLENISTNSINAYILELIKKKNIDNCFYTADLGG